ncbi:MAG: hypothetical protein AB8C95_02435 [Phycisphaeraceae bacterium]
MISSCTHCGAQYQLPDKMLGKQARCKSCKRLFVIVPGEDEIELPQPTGSTTTMSPIADEADDLDALASAASGGDFAPTPRSSSRSQPRDDYEDEPRGPRRMAKGAQASMAMGITACVFTAAGLVLMIIAMANGKDQSLLVTLGIITIGLLCIGAVLSMIAVVNGTAARGKIRRARHPLAGRSEASTGSLTGTIALGVVFACAIAMGIFLAKRGGITFQETVIQEARITQPVDWSA